MGEPAKGQIEIIKIGEHWRLYPLSARDDGIDYFMARLDRIPNCPGQDKANAERLKLAWNCHDDLMKALSDLLPPMPPKNAMCHQGIVLQENCANCKRIAAGHAALAAAQPAAQQGVPRSTQENN